MLPDLVALLILVVEEFVGEGNVVIDHVLAAIVADVEDLCAEAQPVEEAVDLLADVGLPSGGHCLRATYVRPCLPPPSRGWRCKSIASLYSSQHPNNRNRHLNDAFNK